VVPPPEGAVRAVERAKQAIHLIKPGKVWILKGPAGEIVLKAGLIYQGRCVSTLEFDPETGALLPVGYHSFYLGTAISRQKVEQSLAGILGNLRSLDGVEYAERESAWRVPLVVHDMIVAHLKISRDGRRILPDYPAEQEMRAYAR